MFKKFSSNTGLTLLIVLSFILVLGIIIGGYLVKGQVLLSKSANYKLEHASYIILNNAITFLEGLLTFDKTREVNYNLDPWISFLEPTELNDESLIGKLPTGCKLFAQIVPADGKFSLTNLVPIALGVVERAPVLIRLFQSLGFDSDGEYWVSSKGEKFFFNSCETVANLIDFMDADSEPIKLDECQGFESPNNIDLFHNFRPEREEELLLVPGFTFDRLIRALPFVKVVNPTISVDINSASLEILRAIEPNSTSFDLDSIMSFRSSLEGPFVQFNLNQQLSDLLPNLDPQNLMRFIGTENENFEIVVKLDCGGGVFYNKSYTKLTRVGGGRLLVDIYKSFRVRQ